MDITVVTATRDRPKFLALCLHQFRTQVHGLRAEHLVVSDGCDPAARRLAVEFGARYIAGPASGFWGAACRDLGSIHARGEYVVFWDDDNAYNPEALAVLYAAAYGFDVGICQCLGHHPEPSVIAGVARIPPTFTAPPPFGAVDTMCLAVRREIAGRARWADHRARGTDHAYLTALLRTGATYRFLPYLVGRHLQ